MRYICNSVQDNPVCDKCEHSKPHEILGIPGLYCNVPQDCQINGKIISVKCRIVGETIRS